MSNSNDQGGSEVKAPRLDWTISVGNMISLGGAILGMIVTASFLYFRVEALGADVDSVTRKVEVQGQQANAVDGRLIRLETRMDTIIEQNSGILAELRRTPN